MKSDSRWMQDCVKEFHEAMDQPAPDTLDLESVRLELRAKLILEEAFETIQALGFEVEVDLGNRTGNVLPLHARLTKVREPNWPEVVDGLCDLLYVTLGFAVEAGFRLEPFYAEVHHSNMGKVGGPVREDGKVLKPASWKPPRIGALWTNVLRRASKGLRTS